MTRIHSLAFRTLHAGMKLGPMSVPVSVSVSSVFRHPESDAPVSDHKPVAPGPRPAPRCPRMRRLRRQRGTSVIKWGDQGGVAKIWRSA